METTPKKPRNIKLAAAIVTLLILASLIAGLAGYYIAHPASSNNQGANNQLTPLSTSSTDSTQTGDSSLTDNASLSQIYQQVEPSVVVVQDWQPSTNLFNQASYAQVQGSGFTYSLNGQDVIITNFHVVDSAVNVTVTFQDGNTYTAKVLGSDAYSDLAVLSTDAPQSELVPLTITSSSDLLVGDQVIAIGSPYGLTGSMTTGIISALNRTITESTTNSYAISDIIQTSTAINPGNSGGPLLNDQGQVIGITTAIVTDSQGLGFAIPSDTILREIQDLAQNGSYNQHPYLGIGGLDMTYDIATQMKTSVTYGVLIQQVTSGGPADKAGVKVGTTQAVVDGNTVTLGGDIIVGINGNRIRNSDDLSTYLEEFTQPNQTINLAVIRNSQSITISVVLGTRPPPTTGTAS
ncbi:MAG: trypsin-like peptidase domain-containing protein [Candidatus Bathyarchaeia archaeon]|jgi:S1-C subfamily serine protease